MKKLNLLLFFSLLMAISAKAVGIQKEITLSFADDAKNGITWDAGSNTVSGNTLTFSGSWSASKWTFAKPVHVVAFKMASLEHRTAVTFELKDTNNKIYYSHYWGTGSETDASLNLTEQQEGNPDLSQVQSITFNPRDCETADNVEAPYTATFGTITLVIEEDGYDQVFHTPATDASLFPLTAAGVNTKIWNENKFDEATKTLTLTGDGNAAGWTFDTTDLSAYSKLVIELQDELGFEPQLRFRNATAKNVTIWEGADKTEKQSTVDVFNIGLPSDETTIEVDLTAEQFNYDNNIDGDGESKTVALDLSDINGIYFWAWAGEREIKLKNVYLVNASGEKTYLVRNNTAADQYGTIALPYASAVPTNATVYEVVGVDSKENPSELYLQEATTLEAGKGYVFKSTDAENITFDKEGTADDLTSVSATAGLVGTFTETTAPQGAYILVKDAWKKVATADKNKVGAYHTWLVLDESLVVSKQEAQARGLHLMSIGGGNGTTGIQGVEAAQDNTASSYVTLDGKRISSVTKTGVYVKNGKKMIIKK